MIWNIKQKLIQDYITLELKQIYIGKVWTTVVSLYISVIVTD